MIKRDLPRTQGVIVSVDVPGGRRPATLVRFPRNRVALLRLANGRLALKARGRHALTPGQANRSVRVRLRVDRAASQITATAGARRVRVKLRLKAEAHVVLSRTVRLVRIRPLRRPQRRTSVPPGASGGRPPASSTPPALLFAPDSVWNKPLADNAALDPASGTLVKTLRGTAAQNVAAGWGPWIATRGTSPLYVAAANQAPVRVQLDAGSWGASLQQVLEAVPIPDAAVPAVGRDAHMTIYQPSTDRLWEFFGARKLTDGWHASWGGAIMNVSRSPGYYSTDSWPRLSGPHWGATATSLPVIAGTMMIDELNAGVIPHALALNIPWAKPNVYSLPARRTDGSSTDPNAIPEGARFRLDPKLDISTLNLPPMTRMMAVAAQRYGMIVRDQTGHAISFFAEDPAQYGIDPYSGKNGFFGGPWPNPITRAFPWEHLQVVKMNLHTIK